jgi:5-methyltetrahydrofolate--homocysteine methyltransferase
VGLCPDEQLTTEQLIAEKYRGIRPAPGYPACPDHSVKRDMFRVLAAHDAGMALTESLAMTPAASVSGFYMAHPEATYFNVGRIGEDQVSDWAARQAIEEGVARRILAPAL